MKKLLTIAVATLMSGLFAAPFPSASFHCQLDSDFQALGGPNGSVPGKHSQEILWETLEAYLKDGVAGKSAVVGLSADKKNGIHIDYPNPNVLNPGQGSIAFWFNPMDWNGMDSSYHILFRATGPNANLIFYKTPNNSLTFLIGPSEKKNNAFIWTVAQGKADAIKAGEWYFATATWNKDEVTVYLNGRIIARQKVKATASEFTRMGIGGLFPEKWKNTYGQSLIDDFMIYSVSMTPEEVRNRYASYNRSFKVSDDKTPVVPEQLVTLVDEKQKNIRFKFILNRAEADGNPYKVQLNVVSSSDGKSVLVKEIISETPQYSTNIPLDALTPGDYKLCLSVRNKAGVEVGKTEMDFMMPKQPEAWKNNHLGEEKNVPPPWNPMTWNAKTGTLGCWNREYKFGMSLLPEQIFSGKIPLLSAPVSIVCNGETLTLKGKLSAVSVQENEVRLKGVSSSTPFQATVETTGEFDGFIWFDLVLTPENGTQKISSLTLDFPFRKETSTLFNAMIKQYSTYSPGNAGTFKNYNMDLFRNPHVMFVGSEKVGLEWVCEEMGSWYTKNQNQSLQLRVCNQDNLMRLNLIDYPVVLKAPLRFRFGIQALPARPLPNGWRLLHPAAANDPNGFAPYWEFSTRHNSLYEGHMKKDYAKLVDAQNKKYNGRVFHYLAGFTNTTALPEWAYYCAVWSKNPPDPGYYGSVNSPESVFAWNCPQARSLQDYYVWNLHRFIRKYNVNYLYFDNQDAQLCSNALHGCGFIGTDGTRYQSYNVLATRNLTKRIYRVLKAKNPNGAIIRHMSQKPVMPVVSFADYLVDGELFCKTVALDESYKNIFDPEMFRAAFRGSPYGVVNFFIPQFQRAIRWYSPIKNRYPDAWMKPADMMKHRPVLRHFLGYFIVHDAVMWPIFGCSCKDLWKIQSEFGFNGKEQFVIYNDETSPFQSPDQKIMVSCYVLNGKTMIVVMNDTEKSGEVTIRFNPAKWEALKAAIPSELTDFETGAKIPCKPDSFTLEMPARDYRIIGTK